MFIPPFEEITEDVVKYKKELESTNKVEKSNKQLDASWLIKCINNDATYTITFRGLRYVFESKKEVRFFYDSADRNFNAKTGATIQDKISVLSINTKPDSNNAFNNDINFAVSTEYRTQNGYVDSAKIELTQFDSDQDGIVDNPNAFDLVVDPSTNASTKYIFHFEKGQIRRKIKYKSSNIFILHIQT